MQKMLTAFALIVTIPFAIPLTVASEPAPPTAQDMLHCRHISDIPTRVACYDRIADQLGAQIASGEKADSPLLSRAQENPSAAPSDARERSIGQKFLETFGLKEPEGETILLEVSKIKFGPEKQFMVTTSNGQVWLQTDNVKSKLPRDLPFEVSIERGAMGSYFLYAAGQSTQYKVKRLK